MTLILSLITVSGKSCPERFASLRTSDFPPFIPKFRYAAHGDFPAIQLKIFEEAGVQVLKSGCGACINAGIGGLRKEETGVYATNRNFKGRSGDPTAKNYLASPRVVAISAVRGKISDKL